MKVLHVLDHSLPLQSGYVFRTISILEAQHELGIETRHLTTPRHLKEWKSDKEEVDGWVFNRTPHPPAWARKLSGVREVAEMCATYRRLMEIVNSEKPDMIHAHSPVLNAIPAWRAARRNNIPFVYEVRAFWEDAAVDHGSTTEGSLRYRAGRALETWVLHNADAVVTICDGLRDDIIKRGINKEKIIVVRNAVNAKDFPILGEKDEKKEETLKIKGKKILGFVGSFYAYEGLDLLLEALSILRKERDDIAVILVGGGPQEKQLKEQAQRLQLGEAVKFIGRVPHGEVQNYYRTMDILCYPRKSMRLTELVTPLKPLEAMAQGRLVLASDVGGHRELIRNNDTGFLFQADSAPDLALAVKRMLASEATLKDVKHRARAFVETERSWRKSVGNYLPVYKSLVSGSTT